jgi:hypothetical protein
MTIQELEEKIKSQEEFSDRHPMFKGNGDGLQLMIRRDCKGKRIRVAPGIYGEIMFWGGRDAETVFVLKLDDAKRLLELMKASGYENYGAKNG